jgi:hypothetical protein
MQKIYLVLLLFLSELVSSNQNANFDHEIKADIKDIRSNFKVENENFFLTILNGIKGQKKNYYSFKNLNDIVILTPNEFLKVSSNKSTVTFEKSISNFFCSERINLSLYNSNDYFITIKNLDIEDLDASLLQLPVYENTNLRIYQFGKEKLRGYLLLQGKIIITTYEICENKDLSKKTFMLIDWLNNIRNENTK